MSDDVVVVTVAVAVTVAVVVAPSSLELVSECEESSSPEEVEGLMTVDVSRVMVSSEYSASSVFDFDLFVLVFALVFTLTFALTLLLTFASVD